MQTNRPILRPGQVFTKVGTLLDTPALDARSPFARLRPPSPILSIERGLYGGWFHYWLIDAKQM